MKCPKCGIETTFKYGKAKGRQCYLCKKCDNHFTVAHIYRGKSPEIKQRALELHEEGLSLRKIGKRLNVSNVTVYNWIKQREADIRIILTLIDRARLISETKNYTSYTKNKNNELLEVYLGPKDDSTFEVIEKTIKDPTTTESVRCEIIEYLKYYILESY